MSPSSPTSSNNVLSNAVIEAVAKEMDVHPTELPEKLHDVIDPDSLDSLFASRNPTGGTVTFTYCGYEVTVTADGDVSLEE
ncbi:HalOD1 output domain-containing protein [Natronosalvus caseinilyticus]|uniref:HalOD1 output domain-containing protein n=1 Tax=Natronosalvus caseinilyticus TaxID=2953747 RepID=UPI0028B10B57|nr:HalOD1 output domain-containing protein [Natronosalvus caseinilyticus]